MKDKIALRAARAYNYYQIKRDDALTRWAQLRAGQDGSEDIPWKLILMIGGGVIAVGILTWAGIWVKNQLANVGTAPGF